MTQIVDEKGRVLVRNAYQERFLRRQEFANGEVYSYKYDWAAGEYYPRRVFVTGPNQRTEELSVGGSVPEFVRNYRSFTLDKK